MTKRQVVAMFIVSITAQAILGFGFMPFIIGMATGAIFAWAMGPTLNANYRLKPWVAKLRQRRIWTRG